MVSSAGALSPPLRRRRRVLGLAGWPALVLEICVPALFFLVVRHLGRQEL